MALSLSSTFVLQGQGLISENIRFGFKLSPHVSWLSTDSKLISNAGNLTGITVGTVAEWYLSENYVLSTGIGITFGQGGTLEHERGGRLLPEADLSSPAYDSLPGGTEIGYSIRFLEIPFAFRMRTREMGKWRLTFEAPVLSIGVKMRARGDIKAPGLENTEDENLNPEINILNLSYGLSAGAEYSLTTDVSILMALEYRQGFLDITKDHGVLDNGDFEDSVGTTGFLALKAAVLF